MRFCIVRRQAGHGAARYAGFGVRLLPVAGHLHDGPHRHFGMIAEGVQTPEVPAAFVIGQVLIGDGDVFARRRGAAGQGEHMDAGVG